MHISSGSNKVQVCPFCCSTALYWIGANKVVPELFGPIYYVKKRLRCRQAPDSILLVRSIWSDCCTGESAFNHSVIGLTSQCCQDFWKRFGCQSLVDGHARGRWLALMLTHAREVQLCHVDNGTRSECLDPLCHKVSYAQVREETQPAIYSTSCRQKFSQNGV